MEQVTVESLIDAKIAKDDIVKYKRGNWNLIYGECGVYIFTLNGIARYVGRSSCLWTRMVSHFTKGGISTAFDWDYIHFIFTENHYSLEIQLINTLNPDLNGVGLTCRIWK